MRLIREGQPTSTQGDIVWAQTLKLENVWHTPMQKRPQRTGAEGGNEQNV